MTCRCHPAACAEARDGGAACRVCRLAACLRPAHHPDIWTLRCSGPCPAMLSGLNACQSAAQCRSCLCLAVPHAFALHLPCLQHARRSSSVHNLPPTSISTRCSRLTTASPGRAIVCCCAQDVVTSQQLRSKISAYAACSLWTLLRLWKTPPFECRLEDGEFKGRGVDDDKGEVMGLPRPVPVSLPACVKTAQSARACPGSNATISMAERACHACMQVACCSPYMQSRPC